jgi:two-component sensor histidine kinase
MKRGLAFIMFILFALKAPAQLSKALLVEIPKNKPDINRISLMLKLGGYYLYKPGENKNDMDSATNQAQRVSTYQHARLLYLQNHEPADAATMLSRIANIHIAAKKNVLAEKELKQALAEYKAARYKKIEYTCWQLYELEYAKGNFYRGMAYCLQGINSMKAVKDTTYISNYYLGAYKCNLAIKRYEEALGWLRKVIIANSHSFVAQCFLVQLLLNLNRIKEARIALNEVTKRTDTFSLAEKAHLYKATALYYEKIKKYNLALQYNVKILKINSKTAYDNAFYDLWSIDIDNNIVRIYLAINQATKAKNYIADAALILKTSKTPFDPHLLVIFYDNLYKYDVATGNFRDAIKSLEKHDKLRDSLFTIDKDNKLAELDIQYQTVQKKQSIKDLHTQGAVQRAKLEKANLQRNITIAGILIMVMVSILFYRNYYQKQTANNIITHKNDLLQHLLTEKEWLLKEVHHRVKNNLHTVICLLESQAAYLENDALKAIENSQHRIYAMSLIHQKLYQSDDIKTINMATYISELAQSLQDSFDISNQIQFNLKIDPVNLDISHAIPLGLIINEALTNAIKYAFPDKRKGQISISMTDNGKIIKLELADNGIGMPPIYFETEPESLGLNLMQGLCKDIDADINFETSNGTKITIVFKTNELNTPESFSGPSKTKEEYI